MKKTVPSPQRGFTLLELMVVVAIIGILSAVGVVAFTTIQKSGRDARRMQDMKAYQNAQEQYFAQNDGVYYNGDDETDCAVDTILAVSVVDPKSTMDYDCTAEDFGYCACAELEDDAKGNSDGDCSCTEAPCTYDTGTEYFCVSSLQ